MQAKHGDIHSTARGPVLHLVMDPLSFGPILKDAQRKLGLRGVCAKLVLKVFGYLALQGDYRMIHSASTKHPHGGRLGGAQQSHVRHPVLVMLGPTGPSLDTHSLARMASSLLLQHLVQGWLPGACLATQRTRSRTCCRQRSLVFWSFASGDCLFPVCLLLLGPREWLEVGRLQRLFHKELSVEHNLEKYGASNWITYMLQFLREQGVSPAMQDKFNS